MPQLPARLLVVNSDIISSEYFIDTHKSKHSVEISYSCKYLYHSHTWSCIFMSREKVIKYSESTIMRLFWSKSGAYEDV